MLEDWDVGSELGQGLCGGVRVATRKRDGHQVALKLIDMEQLKETFKSFSVTEDQLKENVLKEIEILRLMKHRNIVRLEDTWVHESKTFLCLELVPGEDLLSIIPEKGLAENLAKNLFFQICSAVVYCHANNVIHGDLKPENILVSTVDGRVKLIDFGFAHIVKEGVPLRVIGGTLQYCPPWDPRITYAWDDWAMGVILFAMLSATLPFSVEQLKANSLEIIIPSRITDDALSLLRGFLNPNMEERSSTSDLMLNSDWLKTEREKVSPETMSHCWSRPLEPPTTPHGHSRKSIDGLDDPKKAPSAGMVPSMSVVRAAVEQEERVAAPLVRTKDNFFSFFNKKKNKERRKTPPKRPLDQDLPVADVGKLKSEESLRWSSKGKFPWSPGPGKKNPPLSMSTSSPRSSPTPGVHSPQYRSKGRNRTASTVSTDDQNGHSALSQSACSPPPTSPSLATVYRKGSKKEKKPSLLSLSPPPSKPKKRKSTIGNITREGSSEKFVNIPKKKNRSSSKVGSLSANSFEGSDDSFAGLSPQLPHNKSVDGAFDQSKYSGGKLTTGSGGTVFPDPTKMAVGFLFSEFERAQENFCTSLGQLMRLQSVFNSGKSMKAAMKGFFVAVDDLMGYHNQILKNLKSAGDLNSIVREVLKTMGSRRLRKANDEYNCILNQVYPTVLDSNNNIEIADKVSFLELVKKPLMHNIEEITFLKGLVSVDCEVAGVEEALEHLCMYHSYGTMLLQN